MDLDPITRAVNRQIDGYASFFYDVFVNQNVNGISGDYVEFGSWGGNTMNQAYKAMVLSGSVRPMWAFDSFQGLPEATDDRDHHPGWRPGSGVGQGGVENFYEACDRHGIPRDSYTAIEGYYDQTLPPLGATEAPLDIAVALIDCNMYTSVLSVFDFLEPRLKHGMIVAFDDYYCWTPTEASGERIALREFEATHPQWNFERYKDIHRAGVGFVVEYVHDV